MKIQNDSQLAVAAKKAGELLQAITDYAGRESKPGAAVRFPRRFIRTADHYRARLAFIEDTTLRANAAYTLMLRDVVTWILLRTDISGTAREMVVKLHIFIAGALIESITKEYLIGLCGKSKSYKERTKYLVGAGVIQPGLKTDLDWIWDLRNNMHLFLLEATEYENDYSDATRARCASTFTSFVEILRNRGRLSPSPSAA